jgi:hypothetical protein
MATRKRASELHLPDIFGSHQFRPATLKPITLAAKRNILLRQKIYFIPFIIICQEVFFVNTQNIFWGGFGDIISVASYQWSVVGGRLACHHNAGQRHERALILTSALPLA